MKSGEKPCGNEYKLIQVEAGLPVTTAESVAEQMRAALAELTHVYRDHLVRAARPRVVVKSGRKIGDRRVPSEHENSVVVTSGVPSAEVPQTMSALREMLLKAGGQNLVSDSVNDPMACDCCTLESLPNGMPSGGQITCAEPSYVQ